MDPKRPTPRHIIIKIPKVKYKERILKVARERHLVTYRGVPIRLSANFPKETLLPRNVQSDEKQGSTTKIILSSKLSFRIERRTKDSPDKKKLKEFIITKPVLCKMLKGLL